MTWGLWNTNCQFVCSTSSRLLCLQYNIPFSLRLRLQENTYYISNFRSLPEHCKIILAKTFCKHNLFSNIQLCSGSTGFIAESTWTPTCQMHARVLDPTPETRTSKPHYNIHQYTPKTIYHYTLTTVHQQVWGCCTLVLLHTQCYLAQQDKCRKICNIQGEQSNWGSKKSSNFGNVS